MRQIEKFLACAGLQDFTLRPLKGDGSARRFWRVFTREGSLVLILPQPGDFGRREARSYVLIGEFLRQKGLPVPEIYAYDEESGFILVEDLGDTRLEDLPPARRRPFYQKALQILIRLRENAAAYPGEAALETLHYDASLMWEREARYFLQEFLAPHLTEEEVSEAEGVLRALWEEARKFARPQAILHRDFQSRNLMVRGEELYLIDFQGARLGPSAYDLASLLIDPYVALPEREQDSLRREFESFFPLEPKEFEALALFRNLQILGAFARLSRMGKLWFRDYIPQALKTLRALLKHFPPAGKTLERFLPPGGIF